MTRNTILEIVFESEKDAYGILSLYLSCFRKFIAELEKVTIIEAISLKDAKGNDLIYLNDIKNGISLEKIRDLLLIHQNWNQIYFSVFYLDNLRTRGLYIKKTSQEKVYLITCIGQDGSSVYNSMQKPYLDDTLKALDTIIRAFDPLSLEWADDEYPTGGTVEYYKDPAYFIIDLQDVGTDVNDITKEDILFSANIKKIISNIKTQLNQNELIQIIKQHKNNIVAFFGEAKGIGVIKSVGQDKGHVYPRYFVRQELRKLGFRLNPGYTEETYKKWVTPKEK